MSRTTDWPLVQRSLFRSVLSSNDTAARARYSCSSQEFARRMLRSQSLLRGVLKGTAADRVQTVAVPASGGDVLTALAAFPRAVDITLISREPALASHEQDLLSLLKTPMPAAALAELRAVFACGRGGGYFLGIQLRAFAERWGILRVLLVALSIGGVAVTNITVSPSGSLLPWAVLRGCRGGTAGRAACSSRDLRGRRSRVQIRYLQATLKDPPSMSRVFDALDMTPEQQVNRARETEFLWQGGQSARGAPSSSAPKPTVVGALNGGTRVRGLLIKSAEAAFRGGGGALKDGHAERAAQDALSAGFLARADVLLQDTQSSIRWSTLQPWLGAANASQETAAHRAGGARASSLRASSLRAAAGGILPLGVYIGADEALDALAGQPSGSSSAMEAEMRAEHAEMHALFSRRYPRWRSLHGLRFGYCHGTRGLNRGLLEARMPKAEKPSIGERNVDERGGDFYCAAILAWNEDFWKRMSSSSRPTLRPTPQPPTPSTASGLGARAEPGWILRLWAKIGSWLSGAGGSLL